MAMRACTFQYSRTVPFISTSKHFQVVSSRNNLHILVRNRKSREEMSQTTGSSLNSTTNDLLKGKENGSVDTPKLTFVAHPNPVTGKMDWRVEDENYDYIQEIARSGYGDMLHDKDRNEKYDAAIKQAVRLLREQRKPVKALDIGTGTGLLSMMAVRAGADSVVACEAFPPMAECAERVLSVNKCKDKIKLVHKRSTDVSLDDVVEKANLLITELFDTELIGEGAIGSYTDAHDRLMQDDCVAVPTSGTMYVQAVHSDLLRNWASLQPVHVPEEGGRGGVLLTPPPRFKMCGGAPSLHDLQVDQLEGKLVLLSEPVEVFSFDFSKKKALKKRNHSVQQVTALCDGQVDAFVMWWDLVMDPQGTIILSCAPSWVREEKSNIPWRDHWMQALYYPDTPLKVESGEEFSIHSNHDEYSLWFGTSDSLKDRPICTCGLHVSVSRPRLGQMNQVARNELFTRVLRENINNSTVCLVVSDGSLLPLIAASLGARKVFYIDTNDSSRRLIKEMIRHNGLEDRIRVIDKNVEKIESEDLEYLKIDLFVAEPFFQAAHLPWEHLYFWYALNALGPHLSPSVTILPKAMTIKAAGVQFRDLHKIRAPVGDCEGFDITEFDNLIEDYSKMADENIEPQPLWEYPCSILFPPVTLTCLDFSQNVEDAKMKVETAKIVCHRPGRLNGVVLWTEYDVAAEHHISTGLLEDDWEEEQAKWDMFSRQGVKLLGHGETVTPGRTINISTRFSPETGEFAFTFK